MSFELTTLGEYARVQGGYAYKSKDFSGAGTCSVLKIKNVRFGTVDYSEVSFISEEIANETTDWKTEEGDILISMTGSGPNAPQSLVGRVARVWAGEPEAWINQRVGRVVIKNGGSIHPDFLFYLLSSPRSQDYLVSNSSGSANQANINGKTIESLPCPKVNFDESFKIAKILRELDQKIILNRQTNQTLEHIAQAIFKSWFVDFEPTRAKIIVKQKGGNELAQELAAQAVICGAITLHKLAELENGVLGIEKELHPLITKRFPNEGGFDFWQPQLLTTIAALFPNSLVDSELGEVPEGWSIESIYDISDVIYGAAFKSKLFNENDDGLPLVRIRDLKHERPGVSTPEIHKKGYLIQNGDLLVGMDGEFRPYIWGGNGAWMNQRVCAFKPKKGLSAALIRGFISHQLRFFELTAVATTVIHLGKSDIDGFSYLEPNNELLSVCSDFLEPIFQRVIANKTECISLEEARNALLPKLLSGELTTATTEKAKHV